MTTRREFLKIAGKGIIVLYTVDFSELMAQGTFQMRGAPTDLNSYLRIGEDGRVIMYSENVMDSAGNLKVMETSAGEAWKDINDRIDSIKRLKGCFSPRRSSSRINSIPSHTRTNA